MANWCNNTVTFVGDATKVLEFFKALEKTDNASINGTAVVVHYVGDESVEFESKWVQPDFKDLAEEFGIGLIVDSSEIGSHYFGVTIYKPNGEKVEQFLIVEDFNKYFFDEVIGDYVFREETYECEEDILEILWDERYG